jgi:hypothetical protein
MKRHLVGAGVAILTFFVGWSSSTLILAPATESVSVSAVVTPAEVPSAWTVLLSWQDHDLLKIDGPQKAQLQKAISALRRTRIESFRPMLFSRVSMFPGEERYVLVEESPLRFIPGDSRLQISVFDLEGKLLDSSESGAGWRIALSSMSFTKVKEAGEVL